MAKYLLIALVFTIVLAISFAEEEVEKTKSAEDETLEQAKSSWGGYGGTGWGYGGRGWNAFGGYGNNYGGQGGYGGWNGYSGWGGYRPGWGWGGYGNSYWG